MPSWPQRGSARWDSQYPRPSRIYSLIRNLEARKDRCPKLGYGRFGSPLSRGLETAVCELEGGHRSILFPVGPTRSGSSEGLSLQFVPRSRRIKLLSTAP